MRYGHSIRLPIDKAVYSFRFYFWTNKNTQSKNSGAPFVMPLWTCTLRGKKTTTKAFRPKRFFYYARWAFFTSIFSRWFVLEIGHTGIGCDIAVSTQKKKEIIQFDYGTLASLLINSNGRIYFMEPISRYERINNGFSHCRFDYYATFFPSSFVSFFLSFDRCYCCLNSFLLMKNTWSHRISLSLSPFLCVCLFFQEKNESLHEGNNMSSKVFLINGTL